MELKELKDYLKSQGLKFTRTRRLIFEEIFSEKTVHSNAYEIHRRLKGKGEKISLSGLVSEIDFGESHSHYEPEVSKATHGHLVCLSCGAVKEFSDEKIQSILERIGKERRFKTDKFSIQVFGYCQNCQKK